MNKKLILLALLAFSINAQAQFTLEATYDSAATWNYCQGQPSQLLMVDFEVSGMHYVKVNGCGGYIGIYDLSHSLVKRISLDNLPLNSNGLIDELLYFSENLFDTDPEIEFMYICDPSNNLPFFTNIYNEDGTMLFTDTGAATIIPHYHQQQYPIYNTSQGTKMILSYQNGQAKVFSVAGTLTLSQQLLNENLIDQAYPNPAMFSTRIDYVFPKGITQGDIVFYDVTGQEIKRFSVDNTFDHLLVSTSDIAAGTYYYQLQTNAKNSQGKKLVVVK